jgi:hypothetical protein
MSVYLKLNEARKRFHELKLEKTGHNKFAGYNYFELVDFLIPALKVFEEVGLCAVVSFNKDLASMAIVDVDTKEQVNNGVPISNNMIIISSPLGSAALKGCHEIQNIGACETYCRRYLWVAALEIVEHDALDATTGKAEVVKSGATKDFKASGPEEAFKSLQPEEQDRMRKIAEKITTSMPDTNRIIDIIDFEDLDNDQKAGLWYLLDSKTRSAIKAAQLASSTITSAKSQPKD